MNTADAKHEIDLIKRLAQKETTAIKEFISEYQQSVFRICLGFVHNKEDAEELTQDVLIEVIKQAKKFKGQSKLKTWIYRICYTRSLNKIKNNKWNKWMSSLDDLIGWNEPKTKADDPSQIMEKDEIKTALHRAIDSLPERQRVAFILSKYDQLPYQEIAETMDVSLSSVESLLFRARKNLQTSLAKYSGVMTN